MANVLLLEPNRALAEMYGAALRRAGHVVTEVHSAQDAIEAADEHLPAIVVLELQLAGHDGIEFLHEFRSYPEWQAIPVIVVSNLAPQSLATLDVVLKEDLGVVACLYKPRVSLDRLLKAVAEQVTG